MLTHNTKLQQETASLLPLLLPLPQLKTATGGSVAYICENETDMVLWLSMFQESIQVRHAHRCTWHAHAVWATRCAIAPALPASLLQHGW